MQKKLTPYSKKHKNSTHEVDKIHHEINRIFDEHLSPFYHISESFLEPDIEISETQKEIEISAELPGIDIQSVSINLDEENYLTIRAHKQSAYENNEEKNGYYFSERRFGAFQRSIHLPEFIDKDKINAKMDKGVLSIHIPKKENTSSSQKQIPIQGA